MTDTAQPIAAAEAVESRGDQIDAAADAFKNFLNPQPERPRDEAGRFAPTQPVEAVEEEIEAEPEDETAEIAENDAEPEDTDEAADEAQPDDVDLPASWAKEDAEIWSALPAEAKAKIAEREAQRDAAVNQKFQEAANARKAVEAQVAEANANRDQYAQLIENVTALITPQRPDPYQYGLGTGAYDREAYDLAVVQYEQAQSILTGLQQQREQLSAQQIAEAEAARKAQHDEIERAAWPRFVADVPEMADQQKAPAVFREIVEYAVSSGIPEAVFRDPEVSKNLTSPELHMAWKAMMFDRQKEAAKRVKASKPEPRKAAPAVKPNGITSRQSIEHANRSKAMERLARTGSVEDAAAIFKQHFKG